MAMKDFPQKTKSFYIKCKRVWQILRKPSKEEFQAASKVSAIAILALGFVGFIISLIVSNLF